MTQAEERQRRLQREREEDVEYSLKIKRDCSQIDKQNSKRVHSMAAKNSNNQSELLIQLVNQHKRRQDQWNIEKNQETKQMFARELAIDLDDSKARSIRQAWQQSVAEAQRT